MMPTVLISGGTGLVGTNLTRHLLERKYKVIILTRENGIISNNPNISYHHWDVKNQLMDGGVLDKVDHIIHLAGAGVMDKKWTDEYKKEIINSRTNSAALIINTLKNNVHQVKSFISASAIGYYGEDAPILLLRREGFIETDLPSQGFLSETCVMWEASTEPVKEFGIRLVKLRSGIVLANSGGAFKEFKSPLKFGLATIFGDGKQIMSWIHIDDLCRMFCEAIENIYVEGVYNAVSPEPVSQKSFMIVLAEKMRKKFYSSLYIPQFLLKLFLGKRSIEILKSATVSCKKIKATGFTFLYPTLDAALNELLQPKKN
ncbi:MAG: TIGR01777 family oxidoreductase [Ginsengibacter sp.]|jgi:hypothetical protein